jgi:hypothetical protein
VNTLLLLGVEYADWVLCCCRYDVVPHIIMVATEERQCSYSELGPPHTIDYFVSHVSLCLVSRSWV